MYTLRFDMRAPTTGGAITDLYRAALEMSEWGEAHGCVSVLISEHHTSPDGYLPSPLVLASAIAARTTRVPIVIGAVLLNFYDPVKLAEDMVIADIVSGGRVSYIVGLGYRPDEYAMFGIDMAQRGRVIDEKLDVLRRALAGERFTYQGRRVHVTPAPLTPGGPRLAYGGHTVAAARRAGRFGLDLFAEGGDASLVDAYQAAARAAGHEPGMAFIPPKGVAGTTVFVADDVDRAWHELGPHMLHDARMYAAWLGADSPAASLSTATTVAELRAERGAYRIVTVDEAVAQIRQGLPLSMQPLSGGTPPELAWPSVRLAGTTVQDRLA